MTAAPPRTSELGLAPRRANAPRHPSRRADDHRSRRTLLVTLGLLAVVGLVALRGFLFGSFLVPSASMAPTIEPGDRIMVERLVEDDSLRRGDVIVFDGTEGFASSTVSPHRSDDAWTRLSTGVAAALGIDTGERDYVKRLVGLPGDRVRCCTPDGHLTVNGVPLRERYLPPGDAPSEVAFDVVVPPERLWVMGDNRDSSGDSRAHLDAPSGGMVHVDNLVGRAALTYWPLWRVSRFTTPPAFHAGP
jgi:signal peptidase I